MKTRLTGLFLVIVLILAMFVPASAQSTTTVNGTGFTFQMVSGWSVLSNSANGVTLTNAADGAALNISLISNARNSSVMASSVLLHAAADGLESAALDDPWCFDAEDGIRTTRFDNGAWHMLSRVCMDAGTSYGILYMRGPVADRTSAKQFLASIFLISPELADYEKVATEATSMINSARQTSGSGRLPNRSRP